ncbi:MAG TPA: hypothetical protein P5080_05815 [Candidatus Paceibacterota bacterium]|nr:hypothetical protein [Candidatus Paceibacterota bacterium]HSA37184.1 hypothetical protein [Candidatus Paceibacterota bacterium]
MIAETIFYITGSLFFALVVFIDLAIAYYVFKILQVFLKISEEINGTAKEIKGKVSSFSLGFAGLTALLEKLIMNSFRKGDKNRNENQEKTTGQRSEEAAGFGDEEEQEVFVVKKAASQPKKGKKIKKIKVMEISEE